ncbi:acyl-CoA thioesterase [Pseudogracilibacillus sp. SO30301A]|uniref:acyl-CoA thioesterase n=1 Tax=Pseudogracilibacillus sp. SO30301A TaxID=3098291 RepID=UPI00300DBE49
MMTHEVEIYVRFCETDALGHVNNISHFLYFEEARTKFFTEVFPEKDDRFNFIIASIKCDYIKQAYAGQILKVKTEIKKIGNTSFTLCHRLTTKDMGITIATAEAVIVCFHYQEQKSIPIPQELRTNLEKYQHAIPKT